MEDLKMADCQMSSMYIITHEFAKFEVLTGVWLRIQVFWDVLYCFWVSGSHCSRIHPIYPHSYSSWSTRPYRHYSPLEHCEIQGLSRK